MSEKKGKIKIKYDNGGMCKDQVKSTVKKKKGSWWERKEPKTT